MAPETASADVHALLVDTPEALIDLVVNELLELGAGGIEERESTLGSCLVVYSSEKSRLLEWQARLERRFGKLEFSLERVDPSWTREWIRYLKPEPLTPSFVIQPVGEWPEPEPGQRQIVYEPTLTFGTGGHSTTRLCAREVERCCRAQPGCRVLDVGTGTGVLAFVAALSGAGSVLGIDSDPVAVSSAAHNAALNGLTATCRFSDQAVADLKDSFDLVVANIELGALLPLLPALAQTTKSGGRLLLSGILPEQAGSLTECLEPHGLSLARVEDEGEFRLLCLAKAPDPGDLGKPRQSW